MRYKLFAIALLAAALPFTAQADSYIPIAGKVGNFRTDVRILNTSPTKDVTITAYFLPSGNQFNVLTDGVLITIPKMQMAVYDDIVSQLFSVSGVGAIYLGSGSDQVLATTRIYADTPSGTLGQAYIVPNVGHLMRNGALLQLRANSAFRTNIGALNLQNADAEVTWTLYDKNNTPVSSKTISMPAYGVIAPTPITSTFFFSDAANADLTDAWVSFSSSSPIDAYASVVDNQTTDPTFIPAQQYFP